MNFAETNEKFSGLACWYLFAFCVVLPALAVNKVIYGMNVIEVFTYFYRDIDFYSAMGVWEFVWNLLYIVAVAPAALLAYLLPTQMYNFVDFFGIFAGDGAKLWFLSLLFLFTDPPNFLKKTDAELE